MAGNGNLMKTSIVTDANKDTLAAVDVYRQSTTTTPLNRIKLPTPDIENTFSPIKNSSILADIKKVKNAPTLVDRITTIDGLYSRLSELQSGLKGSLSNLDNASTKELMEALGGDPNSTLGKLVMGATTFNNLKNKDTSAFVKLMTGILGDSKILQYFDLEAEGALLGVLIENAMALGLGDVIDKLIDRASDEKLKKKLMEDNLLTAVLSSDIKTVNKIVNAIGVPKCLAKMPNIVYDLISYYRIDKDKNEKIDDLREEIETLLAKFNNDWELGNVGNVSQPSLLNTFNASNDFRTLYPSKLRPGPYVPLVDATQEAKRKKYEQRVLLLMNAKIIRKVDMYTLARRMYRSIPLMNG